MDNTIKLKTIYYAVSTEEREGGGGGGGGGGEREREKRQTEIDREKEGGRKGGGGVRGGGGEAEAWSSWWTLPEQEQDGLTLLHYQENELGRIRATGDLNQVNF